MYFERQTESQDDRSDSEESHDAETMEIPIVLFIVSTLCGSSFRKDYRSLERQLTRRKDKQ